MITHKMDLKQKYKAIPRRNHNNNYYNRTKILHSSYIKLLNSILFNKSIIADSERTTMILIRLRIPITKMASSK